MEVRFTELAGRDVELADEWWRANRDARWLFTDELQGAVLLLAEAPRCGARVSGRDPSMEVRRLELRRTRSLLFYEVTAEAVTVLRVWHSRRGDRPPL